MSFWNQIRCDLISRLNIEEQSFLFSIYTILIWSSRSPNGSVISEISSVVAYTLTA